MDNGDTVALPDLPISTSHNLTSASAIGCPPQIIVPRTPTVCSLPLTSDDAIERRTKYGSISRSDYRELTLESESLTVVSMCQHPSPLSSNCLIRICLVPAHFPCMFNTFLSIPISLCYSLYKHRRITFVKRNNDTNINKVRQSTNKLVRSVKVDPCVTVIIGGYSSY